MIFPFHADAVLSTMPADHSLISVLINTTLIAHDPFPGVPRSDVGVHIGLLQSRVGAVGAMDAAIQQG